MCTSMFTGKMNAGAGISVGAPVVYRFVLDYSRDVYHYVNMNEMKGHDAMPDRTKSPTTRNPATPTAATKHRPRGDTEIGLTALLIGAAVGIAFTGGAMFRCATSGADEIESCGRACAGRTFRVTPQRLSSTGKVETAPACECGAEVSR